MGERKDQEGVQVSRVEGASELNIRRWFRELPSKEVELLASCLARPDGFAKALIMGRLLTSEELARKIDQRFVRTHRGYYMSHPPDYSMGHNDHLSFSVGRAQYMYAESFEPGMGNDEDAWKGGLGFVIPAKRLLTFSAARIGWGQLKTVESLHEIQHSPLMEPAFEIFLSYSTDQLRQEEDRPPKEDFLLRVHLARKTGKLDGGDQAEVNLIAEKGRLPDLDLKETVVLIPERARDAMTRFLRLKLKEMLRWKEDIQLSYGFDVSLLTPEEVLSRVSVYWYQQKNIGLAIEYLSTHRERLHEFLTLAGDP